MAFAAAFAALILLHLPLLRLPYFWDEAGILHSRGVGLLPLVAADSAINAAGRPPAAGHDLSRPRVAPFGVFAVGGTRRDDADRYGNGGGALRFGALARQP